MHVCMFNMRCDMHKCSIIKLVVSLGPPEQHSCITDVVSLVMCYQLCLSLRSHVPSECLITQAAIIHY